MKRDNSPDFTPQVNVQRTKPTDTEQPSASSRFAKLYADSMIYEEKR